MNRFAVLMTLTWGLTAAAPAFAAGPESAPGPDSAAAPPSNPAEPDAATTKGPDSTVVITGYVQSQLESHEESEDEVRPGAGLVNQNRFLIRRARLKIEREWEFTSFMLELTGDTTKGPFFGVHHAEPSLFYRGSAPKGSPPYVKVTMGVFDVPFGYELVESPRTRFFMERSTQSRAFFPTEPDLGARLSGALGWFRYVFAFVNGNPLGTATGFALQDPNDHKDFVARLGADITPWSRSKLSVGASVLTGRGFSSGTSPTKTTLIWNDVNENNRIEPSELTPNSAQAAAPSFDYERWAVGGDLQLDFDIGGIGKTRLYGEVQLGSNMDRGLYVADPTPNGLSQDSRELGWYGGIVQELTPYGAVGFRFDYYDPNADFFESRSGHFVPGNLKIRTYSPLVALVIPDRARLVFQYDFVKDHMARNAAGIPTDLKNDVWTLRLQGDL